MRTTTFYNGIQRTAISSLTLVSLAFGCLSGLAATTYTAAFDDLSEGSVGTTFSDGGLTFSSLDMRVPGESIYPFVIDQATATLPSPFSSPNALGFGGYVVGPSASFQRFGSAWIDFSGIGSSASLQVFAEYVPFGDDITKNSLSLEAWNGSTMVASTSTSFTTQSGVQEHSLALSGVAPFDRLELYSSGPVDDGVSFILVDNVSVTVVPEPKGLALLPLGIVAGICLRRRTPGS